jgi:hypothetical protein
MLCRYSPCYRCLEEPAASDFMVENLSLLGKIRNSGNFDGTCPPFLADFIGSFVALVPRRRIDLPWQVSLNIDNAVHIHMAPSPKSMMMMKPPWKPSYYLWIFVVSTNFTVFVALMHDWWSIWWAQWRCLWSCCEHSS